jgi:hypothetical protein
MEYTEIPIGFAFTFPLNRRGYYYCTNESFDCFLEDKYSRLDDLTVAQYLSINKIRVEESVIGKKFIKTN